MASQSDMDISEENNEGDGKQARQKTTLRRAMLHFKESSGPLTEKDNARISAHLEKMDGVISTSMNLKKSPQELYIHYRAEVITLRSLITEVQQLGYSSASYQPASDNNDIRTILAEEVNKYRNKFLASLVVQIPILILMWVIPYTYPAFLTGIVYFNALPLYILILLILSSFIQFVMGASFYIGAYKSVSHGSANMDVLVVLGTTAAWLYGFILIFISSYDFEKAREQMSMPTMVGMDDVTMQIHEHAHNFEISSTLITVILLGKFLESFSKKQTVDKLSQLASLKVSKATLLKSPPTLSQEGEDIDVDLLVVGDFIKVQNGQTVPIDGMVVMGSGLCNESMLTGEARPVDK